MLAREITTNLLFSIIIKMKFKSKPIRFHYYRISTLGSDVLWLLREHHNSVVVGFFSLKII